MMFRQRSKPTISPDREERSKRLFQMESNLEFVRRNVRRSDQIEAIVGISTELGIVPELPGKIDIFRIQRLTIGPFQAGFELKYPGLQIFADIAIGRCRQLGYDIGIN